MPEEKKAAAHSTKSKETDQNIKTIAALAYLIFFLPLLTNKDSKFAMYHANQGLVLLIAGIGANFVMGFVSVATLGLGVLLWPLGNYGHYECRKRWDEAIASNRKYHHPQIMDIKRRPTTKPETVPASVKSEVVESTPKSVAHKGGMKRSHVVLIVVGAIVVSIGVGVFVYRAAITKLFQDKLSKVPKTNVKVNTEDGRVTLTGPNGQKYSTGAKLPANFPSDVMIYPGATIRTAIQTGDSTNVILFISGESTKVIDTYRSELVKNGWTLVSQTTSLNKINLLHFEKDSRKLMVQVTPSQANGAATTGVNITISPRK
jgi:hypothetical protein